MPDAFMRDAARAIAGGDAYGNSVDLAALVLHNVCDSISAIAWRRPDHPYILAAVRDIAVLIARRWAFPAHHAATAKALAELAEHAAADPATADAIDRQPHPDYLGAGTVDYQDAYFAIQAASRGGDGVERLRAIGRGLPCHIACAVILAHVAGTRAAHAGTLALGCATRWLGDRRDVRRVLGPELLREAGAP